jgi:hypothetical protein
MYAVQQHATIPTLIVVQVAAVLLPSDSIPMLGQLLLYMRMPCMLMVPHCAVLCLQVRKQTVHGTFGGATAKGCVATFTLVVVPFAFTAYTFFTPCGCW